jgi:hypothetical protein
MQRVRIFVFDSNLAGRHGKGAAKCAMVNYGAIYGMPYGMQGNSFAIPTKDRRIQTLSLDLIKRYVNDFIIFASNHPEYDFLVTRIGCGLAGYSDLDIAPLFKSAPSNCYFSKSWEFWLAGKNFDSSLY